MTGPVYDTPVIPSPPAIRYWKLTHCGTFFPLKWLCETSVPHTTPLPPDVYHILLCVVPPQLEFFTVTQ